MGTIAITSLSYQVFPKYQAMKCHTARRAVKVYDWKTGLPFAYQEILRTVDSGELLPPKTTRHEFYEKFASVNIELTQLY